MDTVSSPKFVVIGGGTGSFMLLRALKQYVSDITALVNMADDGGSTGILRDELGVLPPGDIRQCLVALSDSPHLRELFNYRFPGDGSLSGHTFGNLFLSAVQSMTDDFGEAISLASEVLNINGKVLPITLDDCRLVYSPKSGKKVHGEHSIEMTDMSADTRPTLTYEKPVTINPAAERAILEADMVIIAPGSLYTSLIPALMVKGVSEALVSTPAQVVYVANLVNKPLETKGYTVADYVSELERFSGNNTIDVVLYNTDKPAEEALDWYIREGELLVEADEAQFKNVHYYVTAGHFLAKTNPLSQADLSDKLSASRSLIRHDANAISRALMRLYYSADSVHKPLV